MVNVVAFEKPRQDFDWNELPSPAVIQNVEAEEAVLGGVLIDAGAIARVAELPVEAFYVGEHRVIWQACLDLHSTGELVDLMTVASYLTDKGRIEDAGGTLKLKKLVDCTVSAVNIDKHAELILDKWQRREAIKAAQRAAKIAGDPSTDISEMRGYLDDRLQQIAVPTPPTLRDAIREAIALNPSASEKQATILKLAGEWKVQPKETEKLWDICATEIEAQSDREDNSNELDSLLKAKNSRLDIGWVLPAKLARPIEMVATELGLRPECYLTTLLTGVSTLHPNQTWVRLWDRTDFEVTPNLFAAIVADPSQYKSPVLKAIATKPLAQLQKAAKKEYQEAYKRYQTDLAAWIEGGKDGDAPQEPQRRIYYFTDSTSEGIVKQFAACPQAGLLNLVDELAGKFKSANQYRGGRGSDEEDLLSLYDGTSKVTLRASGIKSDLEDGLNFGLLGSIQPKVLQKFLKTCDDSNGNWSRFIFVNQPLAMAEWKSDGGGVDLTPMLAELYRKISRLPATTYTLSPEAKEAFRKARNRAEYLRMEETRPGMQAYWGKVPGRIGKLALNLHAIHSLFDGDTISNVIPVERVREAIKLCKFYADQILSLYSEFEDPTALPPQLAKVLELAAKKGTVTLRNISRATNWKSDQVKEVCNELVSMGRGIFTKVGKAAAFQQVSKLSVSVEKELTVLLTHESVDNKGFQPTVETVSNCQSFSTKTLTSPNQEDEDTSSHQVLTPISLTVSTVADSFQNPLTEDVSGVSKTVGEFSTVADTLADTDPDPDPWEAIAAETEATEQEYLAPSPQSNLTEADVQDFVEMVRFAIANPEAAEGVQKSLSVFFGEHPEGKQRVWRALSPEERAAYTGLVKPSEPPQQQSLGIDIPPAPSEGNPKGRRVK